MTAMEKSVAIEAAALWVALLREILASKLETGETETGEEDMICFCFFVKGDMSFEISSVESSL